MELLNKIKSFFEFSKHKTNFKTEILAGISTFLALSYIFVVNPSILGEAGMNKSMVLFATIIVSALATFLMGVWAKKPFALAPGMEINAYVAFFVIVGLGFSWQEALGAVFWSGILFMIFTVTGIRTKIIQSIPDKLKSGLALSVGVFLMLIALRLTGVLLYEGVIFKGIGSFFSPVAFVLYFGLALVLLLRKFKVKGSVLISIILASTLAHMLGLGNSGEAIVISKEMFSGVMQLDFGVILNPKILSVILVLFIVDFYGSVAKFIGLTRNTTIVKKDGTLPKMTQTLSVDGLATVAGAGLGTTSLTTFVESGVGIAEGGRTGFTAVVCSVLMLGFIALTPLVNLVPVIATTGALFWVGIHLFPTRDELKKYTAIDIVSVVVMIVATVWTFSIDKALLFGFLIYIIGLALTGKAKKIDMYMVISTVLLLIGTFLSL
ncbi:MAG: AGZA family xanthine/uracil permease-like MFS transporter [Candidatus Woesearchaeota archaeon]|jgi:AGZA family xanthine/uracil permease-like MFS transporter